MKSVNLLELIGDTDDGIIEEAKKSKKTEIRKWTKWGTVAACLCLVTVGAVAILTKLNPITTAGLKGDAGQTQQIGINEGNSYSVAVFPAERTLDEVQNSLCKDIRQEEIPSVPGLCDYVPSALPNGYHFDQASIYETTMKDGAIYKMLLITYRTGKGPENTTDKEGAMAVQSPAELGKEFRIYVCNFKPNTSVKVYDYDEIRKELTKGNPEDGIFYVELNQYYVGLEPLELTSSESLALINDIAGE